MNIKSLQLKRAFRSVLLVLLLSVVGMGKMDAQNLIVNGDFEQTSGFDYQTISDYTRIWSGGVVEGHFIHAQTSTGHSPGGLGWPSNLVGFGGSGYYLLFNGFGGSVNPTKAAWRQTVAVTANTTYTFSVQVRNLSQPYMGLNPNPAQMRLKINGQQVGADLILPSHNNWIEWSNTWNSGSSTQAIIEIFDVFSGEAWTGDDFGLDHLSFVPEAVYSVTANNDVWPLVCCGTSAEIPVLVNDIISPGLQNITVQILGQPSHGEAYYLSSNHKIEYICTDNSFSGTDSFQYRVGFPAQNIFDEAWVYVTVGHAPIVANITAQGPICAGGALNIPTPSVNPSTAGQWEKSTAQNGTFTSFDPNNIPLSMNGNWVRYSASNDCGEGHSNAVQITVYQDDNNITFADANVKAICVANWDTNGDGELSYAEAAAVTYLGQVFRSTAIASFDELQYFINLNSIENYSFRDCTSLASIVIPNSVTSIGVFAFSDCSSLTSIEIPNFVTSIGEWAFSWCTGVASLEIPNSVTSVGEMAFYGCSGLTSLEIPNSVTSIGEMAFYACSSLSLVISYPSIPPELGDNVFYNTPNNNMSIFVYCGALESYQLASGWSTYNLRGMCSGEVSATANPSEGGTISGTGWYEDDQICTLVATANDGYVFACWMENGNLVSSEATYSIPVSGDRTFVALFMQEGNIVFADDNVKSICVAHWDTNHDGELSYAEAAAVANLGQVFSYNTAITSFDELQYFINLNSIVNYEGWLSGCFSGCTNLASIEIPNSVSSIGEMAFSGCCSLTSIEIPTSVTSIGDHAFSGCTGLTSIEIPNSVAYIQSGAFSGCSSLVQIVVESGNTEYDSRGNCNAIIETSTNELVAGCKTTIIPNSVTSIGWAAFSSCTSLTSIEIPNSVTSIKNYAFSGCSGLTSIEIPNSVTSIGYYAFYDCSSLSLIISYPNTPPSLGDNVFYNTPSNMSVFVPCGALEAYQMANGWSTLGLREMCAGEITATANPIEGGTVIGAGYYEGGTACTLTATPNEGYLFLNWSKDGQVVSSDSIYSFIVAGDADFVANFAEEGDVCALTFDLFDSNGDGYTGNYLVVTDGNGISQRLTIESGSSAVYTIPILNGSRLALTWILGSWTEDCSFTVSYSNGNVIYHGENLNEGFSYEFDVDCVGMPVSTFDVMAVANPIDGGTITGTGRYEYNATCTLTAIANEGYTFTNWTENGAIVSNDAEYSFIVSEDRDLVANFVEGDLCAIIFDLFDSYGDGYTGNYLVVNFPDGSSQQLTVESGSAASHTLWIANGSHIILTWVLGSYPEDCSFTVSYSNGNMIYHGENLSSSFSYEFDVDCGFAPIENIVFADANVKAICVANWDTNGDGELSYDEAAAVTDLGQVFRENAEITSFEELQYFIGLRNISSYAFYNCSNLSGSLYIPNSVTEIGSYAFYNCSGLTGSLAIPDSVTTIGNDAFYNCSGLTGSLTIPNSVTEIGNSAFSGCSGFTGNLTIGNSVTEIGGSAFNSCSGFMGLLTISESVQTIGNYAFYNCRNFTGSLTIPNSVTSIGNYAFYGCSKFDSIVVELGNTVYDSRDSCNALIKTSTNELIQGCKNSIIPNSVTTIGSFAFYNCSGLTGSLTIPNSVTEIGSYAFYNCSGLTGSLAIPNSVTTIGNYAFYICRGFTGSLAIPNSVTTIGDWAFAGCGGFTGSLIIPNSVTSIGNSAFYDCYGFTGSLTIPNSVTTIGNDAFSYCSGLSEIIVLRVTPPSLGSNAFYSTNNSPIYVLYESLDDYKTAWSSYASRIFPMAYTTIPGYGEGEGNYRFIASPLVENTDPTAVDNMITETAYDLYRFDQSKDAEWQNYKFPENTPNFFLTNGQGYLYANAEDVNLIFKGEFNEDDTKEVGLVYNANAELAGWNLVGNPFPVNAYANKSYYTINEEGTAVEPNMVSSATAIPACTGVMVMAEAEGETVVFSTDTPEAATNQGCLQIAVAQTNERGTSTCSVTALDKAILSFNAGDRLEKFVFNKENAVISIPQGGKELAIACTDKQGEMPLNFKATKNGEYTITIHPEAAELDYLHLIDNLTGADVDLLVSPAYTYAAKTTDYASRFRLVFSGKEADCPSTGSETFAFVNNGNIIITGAEADAVLQIVDITGRIIVDTDVSRNISTNGMTSGVYVLRLIDGDKVRTQKIVME